jgi:CRISPR-associated protein Csm5
MNETLARLPVRIEALSPVHVGTGERLGRKSFVSEGERVHVVDEHKLLAAVMASPHLQETFVRFCEERGTWLRDYLIRHAIHVGEVAAYTAPLMGERPREVLPFIKMAGTPPQPYLPGSSLKGALRSALLRSALLDDEKLRAVAAARVREDMQARRKPKFPGLAVEREFFGPDQQHDLMRVLQIADSRPLPASRLRVAEVQTLSSAAPLHPQSRGVAHGDAPALRDRLQRLSDLWGSEGARAGPGPGAAVARFHRRMQPDGERRHRAGDRVL